MNRLQLIGGDEGRMRVRRRRPVSPPALFYGKALSNTLQLFGVGLVSLPAVIALYDVEVKEPAGLLLLTLILGALGLAAPGTLYAGLTARLAARQLIEKVQATRA